MNNFFSEPGRTRLDAITQPGLLCAFDFDGTLAPIVTQPEQVCLPRDISQRLGSLACQAPIAIITGRSIRDVKKYLGFGPDYIVGNHGIEGTPSTKTDTASYPSLCADWENQLSGYMQSLNFFDAGVSVENKQYSITIHFRSASNKEYSRQVILDAIDHLIPSPRVMTGKESFNLLPKDAANKGDALLHLMTTHRFLSAIYVGDDVTDEDVFNLRQDNVLTIKVGFDAASAADFYLTDWTDISRLLDDLIEKLRAMRMQRSPSFCATAQS
jgi:trehalose 6-phosphate phosphatase